MEWIGIIQVITSIALVIATFGLWFSTNKYRNATEEMATVTKEYKNIVAAQLLRETSKAKILTGGYSELDEKFLNLAINAHAFVMAEKLLGEGFTKKVKIRMKEGEAGGLFVFDELDVGPDQDILIPSIVWEVIKRNPHTMSMVDFLGEE